MSRFPFQQTPSEANPSLAELARYVGGQMDQVERANFEAQLAEDPMLQDAVEGFKAVDDQQALRKRMRKLRHQSQERILLRGRKLAKRERNQRIRPLWWPQALLGVAAAAALLVLIGLLVRPDRPTLITEADTTLTPPVVEEAAPEQEEPALTPSDLPVASSEATPKAEPQPNSRTVAVPAVSQEREREEPALPERSEVVDDGGDSQVSSPLADPAEAMVMAESTISDELASEDDLYSDSPMPEIAGNAREARGRVAPGAAENAALMDHGADLIPQTHSGIADSLMGPLSQLHQAHASQQWAQVEAMAQSMLPGPDGLMAAYYLGDSYYRQGKTSEAIPLLEQAVQGEEPWATRANWTLALAYLANHEEAKARRIWQTLASGDGPYRVAAAQMLAELNARDR